MQAVLHTYLPDNYISNTFLPNTAQLIVIFVLVVVMLALILLGANLLLAPHNPDERKVSAYESGFSAIHGQTRMIFYVHFWVVALLFVIFDLEIVLLFPLTVSLYHVSLYGLVVAILFFGLMTIGFVLEFMSGLIGQNSKNTETKLDTNEHLYYADEDDSSYNDADEVADTNSDSDNNEDKTHNK